MSLGTWIGTGSDRFVAQRAEQLTELVGFSVFLGATLIFLWAVSSLT